MAHDHEERRRLRRLHKDSRDRDGVTAVGYEAPGGRVQAWEGSEQAPYVHLIGPAHDSPDLNTDPQKIGGHATAGLRAAVGEDDMVDGSFDLRGRLRVISMASSGTALSWTDIISTTYVTIGIPVTLFKLFFYNDTDLNLYVHTYNLTAVPADGVAPRVSLPISPREALSVDFGHGQSYTVGLVVGYSSTYATKTDPLVNPGGVHIGWVS